MRPYRLTGNYGTFEIQRIVEAADAQAAYEQAGIITTLTAAGWTCTDAPDGESWTIEVQDDAGAWVDADEFEN